MDTEATSADCAVVVTETKTDLDLADAVSSPRTKTSDFAADSVHENQSRDSGTGDSGNHVPKSKDSTGKTTKVQKFRQKTWIMMISSQVVLLALIILELALLSVFVKRSKEEMARSNVQLLEEVFNGKTVEMVKLLEITAENAQVYHLIADGILSNVQMELKQAAAQMHFEYFTVVNTSNQVVSALPEKLLGAEFDPFSLVSDLLSSSQPTFETKYAVVPKENLMLDDIVTWRDSNIDGYVLKHPTDDVNFSSALVRYVTGPIKDSSNHVIGALIAGDIITGKHSVSEKLLKELGAGFVLILHKQDSDESLWMISQTVLATGFGTFDTGFESVDESFFDEVAANGEEIQTKLGVVVEEKKFAVAAKQIKVESGKAVLVVGFPLTEVDAIFMDMIISTCLFAASCVIVDLIATFFSIRSFIDPLERLVLIISSKNTKKLDEALKNVKTSKNFIYRILLFSAVSTALLAGMFVLNSKFLHAIFVTEGAIGTQLKHVQNLNGLKIEELISHASSIAFSDNLSALFTAPTEILRSEVQDDLENIRSVFKIEFAFVMDLNLTVISNAGGDNLNTKFPYLQNQVSDVIRNRKGLQFTEYVNHEVYQSFSPPEWRDDSYESSLHPTRSTKNVVVRFVLAPVVDPSDRVTIHGVVVLGDIFNGKGFESPRESVEFFHEGYTGIYWFDPETKKIEILSSYLSDEDSYDRDAASKSALERVKMRRETVLENDVDISDKTLSIAVERIDPGFEFDVYSDAKRPSAKYDQLVFVVRGTEYAAFKSMERSQLALEVCSIILNALFSIGIAVYTFVPIYKFTMHIKMQMSSKVRPSALPSLGASLVGAGSTVVNAFKSMTKSSAKDSSRKESIEK